MHLVNTEKKIPSLYTNKNPTKYETLFTTRQIVSLPVYSIPDETQKLSQFLYLSDAELTGRKQ